MKTLVFNEPLESFLKRKGAKRKFARARKEQYPDYDIEQLENVSSITAAFSWSETKEGYNYWSELSYKYILHLNELEEKLSVDKETD
jgi:hypothetical protein